MGIALICDLPGCGKIIPQDETDAILEEFGDAKPPAIKVEVDGETELLLEDVCRDHREQFRRLIVGFSTGNVPAVEEPEREEPPAKRQKRSTVKLPETGDIAHVPSPGAVVLVSDPSPAFVETPKAEPVAEETTKASDTPESVAEKPKKAAAGPQPLKRTAQRKNSANSPSGQVTATLEEERETIIEPSLASVYDFSGTTPSV